MKGNQGLEDLGYMRVIERSIGEARGGSESEQEPGGQRRRLLKRVAQLEHSVKSYHYTMHTETLAWLSLLLLHWMEKTTSSRRANAVQHCPHFVSRLEALCGTLLRMTLGHMPIPSL